MTRRELKHRFLAEEKQNHPHRGNALRYDRGKRRAPDSHPEHEYEERVERDVEHRAYRDGRHRRHAETLRRNKGIQPQRQHHEYRARTVNEKVIARVRKPRRRRPEKAHERLAASQHHGRQHRAHKQQQPDSAVENLGGVLFSVLAQFYSRQRRAAHSDKIAERADDKSYRENDAKPGKGVGALSGDASDIHPVHKIVKQVDDLRHDRRQREFQYGFADGVVRKVDLSRFSLLHPGNSITAASEGKAVSPISRAQFHAKKGNSRGSSLPFYDGESIAHKHTHLPNFLSNFSRHLTLIA